MSWCNQPLANISRWTCWSLRGKYPTCHLSDDDGVSTRLMMTCSFPVAGHDARPEAQHDAAFRGDTEAGASRSAYLFLQCVNAAVFLSSSMIMPAGVSLQMSGGCEAVATSAENNVIAFLFRRCWKASATGASSRETCVTTSGRHSSPISGCSSTAAGWFINVTVGVASSSTSFQSRSSKGA